MSSPPRPHGGATVAVITIGVAECGILFCTIFDLLPQQNALFYVGGYVCKKYLAKHICKECTSSLTCSELSDLSDSSTTFLQQKSYNSVSSGKSGLAIPSSALVLFLKKCEDVFVSHFMGIMHYVKGMSKAGQLVSFWQVLIAHFFLLENVETTSQLHYICM